MSDLFEGKYEVWDWYTGGARPQRFYIPEWDLVPDMTDDDLEELFEDRMRLHFDSNIFPRAYGSSVEDFKEWARERMDKQD